MQLPELVDLAGLPDATGRLSYQGFVAAFGPSDPVAVSASMTGRVRQLCDARGRMLRDVFRTLDADADGAGPSCRRNRFLLRFSPAHSPGKSSATTRAT